MLISLFRNQQRVISFCSNDLSVTRSWPFITHYLRCFLTKPREKEQSCSMMFSQVGRSAWCMAARPTTQTGHPASKAFQSQPQVSSPQKGLPNGQTLTFWVGKKMVKRRTKPPILNLFWYLRREINSLFSYEVIFLSMVWFPMARGYKGQNQNTAHFYWDKTACSCCKAFLPAVPRETS